MENTELIDILSNHINKYPKMEVQDVIKLLYQNEFGGGHLISDSNKSFTYLTYEYENIKKDFSLPLYEDIGNNLVRLNLKAIDITKISLIEINDIFVSSSNKVKGSMNSFLNKIELVKQLTINNFFNFSYEELNEYLNQYKKNNYPIVSHSKTYKDNYDPSYRVILKDYLRQIKTVY